MSELSQKNDLPGKTKEDPRDSGTFNSHIIMSTKVQKNDLPGKTKEDPDLVPDGYWQAMRLEVATWPAIKEHPVDPADEPDPVF